MTHPAWAHRGVAAVDVAGVAWGSAAVLAETGLRVVVTALLAFWMAARLGPAGFGVLTLASSLAAVGTVLMAQGLDLPVLTRLARGAAPAPWLGAALVLRLAMAALVLVLLMGAAWWLQPHDMQARSVIMIVALCVPAYAVGVVDMGFRSRVQAVPAALARLLATALAAVAKVAALLLDASLVWLAWAVVLEAVLASALLLWAWRRAGGAWPLWPLWPRWRRVRVLWWQGVPLGLAMLMAVAQLKADALLLGALAAASTVGQYALAQKLGEALLLVPVVVLDLAFALLLRSAGSALRQDQMLFDLASAGAWLVALLNLLAAPLLIDTFFGPGYAAAAPLAQVLGLGVWALALDAARQRWLLRQGLQALAWRLGLCTLVLTLAALALAVAWGGGGAVGPVIHVAWAMVVAGWLGVALVPWLDVRTRPLAALQVRALWPWGRLVRTGWRARQGAVPTQAAGVVW